jgi:hypothetical protein
VKAKHVSNRFLLATLALDQVTSGLGLAVAESERADNPNLRASFTNSNPCYCHTQREPRSIPHLVDLHTAFTIISTIILP